jgi:hypothetical protein
MPLSYQIDAGARIVRILGDYAEPREWHTLLAAIAADQRTTNGYGFLRDLRHSGAPVSAESVVGIIAVVRQFWSTLGVRRAAIATRPGIDVPAMVAEALAEDERIPLRAFNSYEEAVAWLQEGDPAGTTDPHSVTE